MKMVKWFIIVALLLISRTWIGARCPFSDHDPDAKEPEHDLMSRQETPFPIISSLPCLSTHSTPSSTYLIHRFFSSLVRHALISLFSPILPPPAALVPLGATAPLKTVKMSRRAPLLPLCQEMAPFHAAQPPRIGAMAAGGPQGPRGGRL